MGEATGASRDWYDMEDVPPERRPVNSLILSFVLDEFRSRVRRGRWNYPVDHLAKCDTTRAESPKTMGAHSCSEGTCDYDPEATAQIVCDHNRHGLRWTVNRETFAELLDAIATYSDERAARVDAFIGRTP